MLLATQSTPMSGNERAARQRDGPGRAPLHHDLRRVDAELGAARSPSVAVPPARIASDGGHRELLARAHRHGARALDREAAVRVRDRRGFGTRARRWIVVELTEPATIRSALVTVTPFAVRVPNTSRSASASKLRERRARADVVAESATDPPRVAAPRSASDRGRRRSRGNRSLAHGVDARGTPAREAHVGDRRARRRSRAARVADVAAERRSCRPRSRRARETVRGALRRSRRRPRTPRRRPRPARRPPRSSDPAYRWLPPLCTVSAATAGSASTTSRAVGADCRPLRTWTVAGLLPMTPNEWRVVRARTGPRTICAWTSISIVPVPLSSSTSPPARDAAIASPVCGLAFGDAVKRDRRDHDPAAALVDDPEVAASRRLPRASSSPAGAALVRSGASSVPTPAAPQSATSPPAFATCGAARSPSASIAPRSSTVGVRQRAATCRRRRRSRPRALEHEIARGREARHVRAEADGAARDL